MKFTLVKLFILFLFISASIDASYSQPIDFNHYQPITSKGNLPLAFTQTASEKYRLALAQLAKEEDPSELEITKRFLRKSIFNARRILSSGQVLFNDTLGIYANSVLQTIVQGNPSLQNKLHIYVFRSSVANASTLSGGIILVSIGLLARVENDAQLAFILCHEISHLLLEHGRKRHLENVYIRESKYGYKGIKDEYGEEKASSKYSRSLESEADSLGLVLFQKTIYNPEAVHSLFALMARLDMPFSDDEFDHRFLEVGNLRMPQSYLMPISLKTEVRDEPEVDSLSSHPYREQRLKALLPALAKASSNNKILYTTDEKNIKGINKIARYELCRLYSAEGEYERALYNVYLLQSDHPNSEYLIAIKAQNLFRIAQRVNEGSAQSVLENMADYRDENGKDRALYYLLENLSNDGGEITMVALRHLLEIQSKGSALKGIKLMIAQLIQQLVIHHQVRWNDLIDGSANEGQIDLLKPGPERYNEFIEVPDTSGIADDNFDQIEYNEYVKEVEMKRKQRSRKNEFVLTGLFGWVNNKEVKDSFLAAQQMYKMLKPFKILTEAEYFKKKGLELKAEQKRNERGKSFGANRILVYNSIHHILDYTTDYTEVNDNLASERATAYLQQRVREIGAIKHISSAHLNAHELTSTAIDSFNDMVVLAEYFGEKKKNSLDLAPTYLGALNYLGQKYEADYIVKISFVTYRLRKEIAAGCGNLFLGSLFPALAYLTYSNALSPLYKTAVIAEIINLKTGEASDYYTHTMVGRNSNDVMDVNLYHLLYQLNQRK
jgi:predicted Zn-dependent protease